MTNVKKIHNHSMHDNRFKAAGSTGRRPRGAPVRLAVAALVLLAPGGTAVADAAWETTITVGNKAIIHSDNNGNTAGPEWERGYRRQWCMDPDAIGSPYTLETPADQQYQGFATNPAYPDYPNELPTDHEHYDADYPGPEDLYTYFDNCYGTITDKTFEYKGRTHRIEGIYHYTTQNTLVFDFKKSVPKEQLDYLRGGWFEIKGREFTVNDALKGYKGNISGLAWRTEFWGTDTGWTVGEEITVSFHGPPSAVPELASATVSADGAEIALVFDEALDTEAANGPPASAFTVTAAGAAIAVGSAAVVASEPRQVRLSGLSPAIVPGQAAVVTYTDPTTGDDSAAVQDTNGNDAPSFTTGADGVPAAVNGAVPVLSVDDVSVTEGTDDNADFLVRLTPAATETVTVDYATADGTAMQPDDYTNTSGMLTFNAGETEKTVSVPIVDDSVEDGGETFTFTLSNPSANAALGDAEATATINNDEGGSEDETALTAQFSGLPDAHGGDAFTFELAFSEAFPLSYLTLLDAAFTVTGGAVTRAARVTSGDNSRWTVTVEPDGTGDVTVTLQATTDCEAADAICTEDDRPLSAAVSVSVPNEVASEETPGEETPSEEPPVEEQVVADPLTVRLAGVPAEHDGSDSVSFEVHFSEEPHEYSYRTLRDTTLRVAQGGTSITPHVKRMQSGSNQSWTVTVEPVSQAALSVSVSAPASCSAADAVCTEGGEPLSNAVSATVAGPPGLFVADARVREAAGATLDFAVTLSRASASTVTVDYATSDGSATAGQDYTSVSGTLTFNAGETAKTVSAPVLDDAHDDGGETLTLTLSNPSGGNAYLADGTATGTIENADPQPQAWLARFGRGAAMQTVDLLTDRFEDAAMGDNRLTLGGRSLDPSFLRMQESRGTTGRPADDTAFHRMPQNARGQGTSALTPSIGESGGTACPEGTPCNDGHDDPAQDRRATPLEQAAYQLLSQRGRLQFDARRFLSQSSFNLSLSDPGRDAGEAVETVRAAPEPAGHWSLWGRGAMTRFNGVDEGVRMDGDVLTGLVGVDYARDRWLAGAALAWHDGDGAYTSARGGGALDSTLITVSPYLRYAFTGRLSAWGTVGYGTGSLTLRPDTGGGAGEAIETDLGTTMGAAGLRGVVYASAATELALKSDALWVRTTSAETAGLRSAEADAARIRLLLSGRHQRTLANDALLVPGFELGLRYDGGDAETGFGVELGGGLRYEDALRGLRIETKARALLAHQDGGYEEWGISGSVSLDPGRLGRGLALSLASGWGLAESGAEAMWQRQGAAGLSAQHDSPVQGRLAAELGYGLDVPWTYGILTPYSGMEWAGQRRTLTLGWRFNLGQSLTLSLDGERRESAYEATDHGVMLNTSLPW